MHGLGVMHEVSIAASLFEAAERLLPPGARLEEVHVAVGELSAVEPDLLVYAWEGLRSDTPFPDAELHVEWRQSRQFCPACNRDFPRPEGGWLEACPRCDSPLEIRGGYELDLLRLVYTEPNGESDKMANRPGREDSVTAVAKTGDRRRSPAGM
ncbi:MAG: hypothetical protein Kow00109_14050 [Acidobacteriota bacterium]